MNWAIYRTGKRLVTHGKTMQMDAIPAYEPNALEEMGIRADRLCTFPMYKCITRGYTISKIVGERGRDARGI